jgi:hypothetical protein
MSSIATDQVMLRNVVKAELAAARGAAAGAGAKTY